jgi:membrane protein involved in colicin uptake
VRKEAEAKAQEEAAEKARKEAEAKAQEEAVEKARREAEAKAQEEAAEKARKEAEAKAQKEAAEKARKEAEAKATEEAAKNEKARLAVLNSLVHLKERLGSGSDRGGNDFTAQANDHSTGKFRQAMHWRGSRSSCFP